MTPFSRTILLDVTFLFVATIWSSCCAREIQVKLEAPWVHRAVHPLVETAEFLAEESPNDFWKFVNQLCSSTSGMDVVDNAMKSTGDDAQANISHLVQAVSSQIVSSNMESILEISSNIGMYVPAVEFYESLTSSLYAPCGPGHAYVIHYPGGDVSCSQDKDTSFVHSNSDPSTSLDDTVNMPWNHEYPFGPEKKTSAYAHKDVQVLYGVVGSSSFCKIHSSLSAMAADGTKRYIARHAFPGVEKIADHRDIQGYGVFLDIKNMEYRNAAENKNEDKETEVEAGSDEEIIFDREEEVEGVVFATLKDRYPHLAKELKIAREELITKAEESSDSTEMKMWKVLDLGLQTTQSIATSPDSITAMSTLLHNFPKHASSLSSVRVDDELKESVAHFYRSGAVGSIPPDSLYINGLRVDLSGATLNVFGDVIGNIRKELKNSDFLNQQGVTGELKKELLRHAAAMSPAGQSSNSGASREEQMMEFVRSVKRVDVSKGGKYAIQFMNNLEKDAQYKRLPRSLTTLLQPSWQLIGISKNIYTLVAVINPVSVEGASMLYQLNQIYEQQYPVRIGITWACNAALSPVASQNNGASAEDACRLFGQAKKEYGYQAAMAVMTKIGTALEEEAEDKFEPSLEAAQGSIASAAAQNDIFVTKKQVAELYAAAISTHNKKWTAKNDFYEEAMKILREEEVSDFVLNSTQYLTERGLPPNSFSVNGVVHETDDISSHLMHLLGREQQVLSILVSMRKITDRSKSIFSSILKYSTSFTRYHSMIEEDTPDYIDIASSDYQNLQGSMTRMFDSRAIFAQVCGAAEGSGAALFYNTTVIATPVHTDFGLKSLHAAITWFLQGVAGYADDDSMTCRVPLDLEDGGHHLGIVLRAPAGGSPIKHLQRLAVLSVMLESDEPRAIYLLKSAIEMFLEDFSLQDVLKRLGTDMQDDSGGQKVLQDVVAMLSSVGDDHSKIVKVLEGDLAVRTNALKASAYATRALDSANVDDVVLHFNSRKLSISSSKATPLHPLDINMLVEIEYPRIGASLAKTLKLHPHKIVDNVRLPFTGDDYLFMTSYCGRYAASGNRADVMGVMEQSGFVLNEGDGGHVPSKGFVFDIQSESKNEDVSLIFVCDPLSIAGQRTAALTKLIKEQLQLPLTVILVPQLEVHDFPLQNFFRFVSPVASGASSSSLSGVFKKLPRQHTLTVRIDTPEPWNVQALAAEQDIDNFKCTKNKCGDEDLLSKEISRVSYQLKNMAIAGQCYEGWASGRPNPPNGLQIVLHRAPSPLSPLQNHENTQIVHSLKGDYADTLVMKNLGYYQLQANPGLWQLGLAEGRAASLFTIDDAQRNGQDFMWVPVHSFATAVHQIFVTKRPGMEAYSLLDDENEDGKPSNDGMWSKLSAQMQGLWGDSGKSKTVSASSDEDNRIHIFSLATGQVYERLLRIMMLSAVKRTSVPIKFWLFEYYLSPSFKATVEAMCAEYNFEVGYVVYKWPEWLNQQTEKQRIIWGYKILFLDVLFPLNVKKVIYVDADQVVRADLKELWDMDLHGKPYAYTPFCDSREDTLGFQFWRQGYWADHLRGKPYHISALYVVDLQVFRQRAVGDSLRAVYDQLSKDPNSLSNLDQDLPNYAQHVVPIHSLPQEWLWCESWCSDKTKKYAKTIDLCNNPRYKEPKLDMAKRVISGNLFKESWVELDDEIKSVIVNAGLTVEY